MSHVDDMPWRFNTDTNPFRDYIGNAHADALADKGGSIAEPAARAVEHLLYWTAAVSLVQKRYLAIMLLLVDTHPRTEWEACPPSELPNTISHSALRSQHTPEICSGRA